MKNHRIAKLSLVAAFAFGLNTLAALAADQQNLPPFKSQKELREWVAQNKARDEARQNAAAANQQAQTPDDGLFYTGKPYVKDLEGYAFKFRTYNPELQRWTTEDPSGFPDGPNASYYAPTPTSQVDWMGLNGKAVVWIVGWTYDIPGGLSQMKASHNGALEVKNSLHMEMETADRQSKEAPTGSPTHYIDDGDIFEIKTANSWQEVGELSTAFHKDYTAKVYLFAHGDYANGKITVGTENPTSIFVATAMENYNLYEIGSCANQPAEIDANGIVYGGGWNTQVKKFLTE